jgi:cytochrome b
VITHKKIYLIGVSSVSLAGRVYLRKNKNMIPTETETSKKAVESSQQVLVWDLPTRLFHWLLVILVIASFITGKIGGVWMQYHMFSGYTLLGLLVFRLIWGFIGGRYARFLSFIHGPSQVFEYARTLLKKDPPKYLGHNPLGGWSVLAMLITLSLQIFTGLFADDDIFTKGPFNHLVSNATSEWLTHIHRLNQDVILFVIGLHVMAILFYLIIKKENLIKPMFTGFKDWYGEGQASTNQLKMALLIASLITVAIFLLLY